MPTYEEVQAKRAAREQAVQHSYEVLNRAEHHGLAERLNATATMFLHGTAGGMGDSAALDRIAQGVAFLCEHAARQVTNPMLIGRLEELRQRHGFDAADTELMKMVVRVLGGGI